jgi:hypothetical protein
VRLLRSARLSTVERVTAAPEPDAGFDVPRGRPRGGRMAGWLAPTSPVLVYAGIALIVAGFGVLAYTWSKVAGTLLVALQIPYLISGGFTGLGLVVLGVLLIYLGAKRRDAFQRDRRLEELAALLDGTAERDGPDA